MEWAWCVLMGVVLAFKTNMAIPSRNRGAVRQRVLSCCVACRTCVARALCRTRLVRASTPRKRKSTLLVLLLLSIGASGNTQIMCVLARQPPPQLAPPLLWWETSAPFLPLPQRRETSSGQPCRATSRRPGVRRRLCLRGGRAAAATTGWLHAPCWCFFSGGRCEVGASREPAGDFGD